MDTSLAIRRAEALIRSTDDACIMTQHSSILEGKNVGVIGFNARPIAASLRKRGAFTYVSDYWGDSDLKDVSTGCIAILSPVPGIRQRQPLELPLHQALIDNLLTLTSDVELDYVIAGSGFDDCAESLNLIHEKGLLTGTPPAQMSDSRNFALLSVMLQNERCKLPSRQIIETQEELRENSHSLKFPCLVRPVHSGGGSGIRLARNKKDLNLITTLKFEEAPALVIQEYIRGRDLSCSVLSTGTEARVVSVQNQLIGTPSAGRNCDFAYCGNSIPVDLYPQVEKTIRETSEYLAVQLGLQGSIGFDFVVDISDRVWLMEVNPRIQGTLEMLEIAGDISITEQHVRASNGELIEKLPTFDSAVKMIVYSRKTGAVPDLSKYLDVYDRSQKGIKVERRDPICTVIKSGGDIVDCYRRTCETAYEIQRQVLPLNEKTK